MKYTNFLKYKIYFFFFNKKYFNVVHKTIFINYNLNVFNLLFYFLVSRRFSSHIKQLSVQPKNLDCQLFQAQSSPSCVDIMFNNYELALSKCCSVTVIYLLLLFSRSLQIIYFIFFPLNPSKIKFHFICYANMKRKTSIFIDSYIHIYNIVTQLIFSVFVHFCT